MPKLAVTIRYLESAARLLDDNAIAHIGPAVTLLAQAGLSTRAISEILSDYGITLHYSNISRRIRSAAPELPL